VYSVLVKIQQKETVDLGSTSMHYYWFSLVGSLSAEKFIGSNLCYHSREKNAKLRLR